MWRSDKQFWLTMRGALKWRALGVGAMLAAVTLGMAGIAAAQTVRQWTGTVALSRQPGQVFATNMAEWRSLWSRVGKAAPDMFESGRMTAVGIFLGQRAGPGYSVNILSAGRRRDHFMVVFEERAPDDVMMAERMPPSPRPVAAGPAFRSGGGLGFASPGVTSLPPMPARPTGPPTSPWAILLIDRVDLPITVEQRLFR